MLKDEITIALPKGRNLEPSIDLFQKVSPIARQISEESRKLFFQDREVGVRFFLCRQIDVPTYVEHGAADMGVVGKEVIVEQGSDIYEPLDLKFGFCRLVVAEPLELSLKDNPKGWSNIRVATEFPNITEHYFTSRGVQVEIIKLYGSIELAPLAGLSERIVDLVSTGRTLREHGLVEVEEIMRTTARLVVNRASHKTKYRRVRELIEQLKEGLVGYDYTQQD